MVEPTVLRRIRLDRIGEEKLWFTPTPPTVPGKGNPDFRPVAHAVHLTSQSSILRVDVSIVMEGNQRLAVTQMEDHRRGIRVNERDGSGSVQVLPSSMLRASQMRPGRGTCHEIDLSISKMDRTTFIHATVLWGKPAIGAFARKEHPCFALVLAS